MLPFEGDQIPPNNPSANGARDGAVSGSAEAQHGKLLSERIGEKFPAIANGDHADGKGEVSASVCWNDFGLGVPW